VAVKVGSDEKQLTADKIAWQQKVVKEVINKIRVTQIQMTSMLDTILDGMITAMRTTLPGKRNIKSVNDSFSKVN
jgi:osmotically-inducible protein OsmY